MEATLVGGGALEFHAPGPYTTSDIDLVVEGRTREDLDAALTVDETVLWQRLAQEDAVDALDALRTVKRDLTELRAMWEARRRAARDVMHRIEPNGMRRPAPSPEERAWLESHDGTPFVEDEASAALAAAYYARKYSEGQTRRPSFPRIAATLGEHCQG